MSFRSLRWQIQIWHAVLLATITSVLLTAFYFNEKQARLGRMDAQMSSTLIALFPLHFAMPGPEEFRPAPPEVAAPDFERNLEKKGFYIIAFDRSGNIVYRSPAAPAHVEKPAESGPKMPFSRLNQGNREAIQISPLGEIVILGISTGKVNADLWLLAFQLVSLCFGIVVVGLAGGNWIATRVLRPLRQISDTAMKIAAGKWDHRIDVRGAPAELADLGTVLNQSFDEIEAAYQQQVRFTADASHELGTPVSIIVSQTQMALSKRREPREYIEALEACRRAGERMKDLTRDLLELAGYDAGNSTVRLVACDLAELASEAIQLVKPLAEERHATIEEHLESVFARVQPLAISQVFVNLLTNAIKHNAAGVRIRCTLRRDGVFADIAVMDSGGGIPPEALPYVFERFYRAEKSRSRAQGGAGLGLAICKKIVESHGGAIAASNEPDGGACFSIRLPIHLAGEASNTVPKAGTPRLFV